MEEKKKEPPCWKMAKQIMPNETDEEKLLEAARNLEHFVEVLYRICDRQVREEEEMGL